MSTYRMTDGTIVRTENATQTWEEDTYWDGHNHISVATGDQWVHQQLYRSRKGRYWLEYWSQWHGARSHAEWISPEEAVRWLLASGHELPSDLADLQSEIEE